MQLRRCGAAVRTPAPPPRFQSQHSTTSRAMAPRSPRFSDANPTVLPIPASPIYPAHGRIGIGVRSPSDRSLRSPSGRPARPTHPHLHISHSHRDSIPFFSFIRTHSIHKVYEYEYPGLPYAITYNPSFCGLKKDMCPRCAKNARHMHMGKPRCVLE